MNGLEKIKNQILSEANSAAAEMIAEAKSEAAEMMSKVEAEGKAEGEKIAKKAEASIQTRRERAVSAIELSRKQAILLAKQEVIAQILDGAYETLINQDTESYFQMIGKMIEKYALAKAGTIAFSEGDLKRMPEGFEQRIHEAAKACGGSLELESESRKIEGGFVLIYGGIEENCTLSAMFHSAKDELSDQVHKFIF